MKKVVIAAFVVWAVPALAIPRYFSAAKEAVSLQRAANTRSDRSERADRRDTTESTRSSQVVKQEKRAPEANR